MNSLTGTIAERLVWGTTIPLLYDVHVPRLSDGEERALAFQLLRGVPSVIVSVRDNGQALERIVRASGTYSAAVCLPS